MDSAQLQQSEQERLSVSSLRRELDLERGQKWQLEQTMNRKVSQLQTALDNATSSSSEDSDCVLDMKSKLEKERQQHHQLQQLLRHIQVGGWRLSDSL